MISCREVCQTLSKPVVQWILFAGFFVLLFMFRLNEGGLYSPQEPRAGLIAWNMIQTDNYLDMVIVGDETLQKPVFSYWLTVISMKLFGHNEFAVRLPSTFGALATLLATFFLGRAMYGRRIGILSMFILGSMLSFVHLSRIARIDIILTALFTTSLYLFYKGYIENDKANSKLYLFYIVLGLSVLTKGPVTVALAGMIIIAYCAMKRDWGILWKVKPISGAIIGAAIVMPWFLYENYRTGGEFFHQFFLGHNVERFLGASGEFGKKKPLLFYVPQLFAGALPWSIFFPLIIISYKETIFSFLKRPHRLFFGERPREEHLLSDKMIFLLWWFVVIFLFFSLSAFKRKDYLLPLYPPLAIMIAHYALATINEGRASTRKIFTWITGVSATVFSVGFAVSLSGLLSSFCSDVLENGKKFHVNTKDAFMMLEISKIIESHLIISITVIVLILFLFWWIGLLFSKAQQSCAVYIVVTLGAVLFTVYEFTLKPLRDELMSTKPFIEEARAVVKNDEKVLFFKTWNLEAAFFLNKPYGRAHDFESVRNNESIELFKYFIFRRKFFDTLTLEEQEQFTIIAEMNKRQRRPLVFAKVRRSVKSLTFPADF